MRRALRDPLPRPVPHACSPLTAPHVRPPHPALRVRAPRHACCGGSVRCCRAFAVGAPSASAYELGFNDNQIQGYAGWRGNKPNDAALAAALQRMRATGTQTYRIMVMWSEVTKPAAAAPTPASLAADPAWSGYRWDDVDRLLKAARAAGLRPLVWFAVRRAGPRAPIVRPSPRSCPPAPGSRTLPTSRSSPRPSRRATPAPTPIPQRPARPCRAWISTRLERAEPLHRDHAPVRAGGWQVDDHESRALPGAAERVLRWDQVGEPRRHRAHRWHRPVRRLRSL